MQAADLEIQLRRRGDGGVEVTMRLESAEGSTDTVLTPEPPPVVALSLDALRPYLLDAQRYGQALGEVLFGEPHVASALRQARTYAATAGVPLRMRLFLDRDDAELHAIRWEQLRDPSAEGFLAQSERLLLSRYLPATELTPFSPGLRDTQRALVAVASPVDSTRFNPPLHPVDVADELAAAGAALGDIPTTVLARERTGAGVSLDALAAALRSGVEILYLVCHGRMVDDDSRLFLEQEDGTALLVRGSRLVEMLAGLAHRPALVVLASCQSSGQSHDDGALAALGPRLAQAGIPAVIAMQGNVAMVTARTCLATFFNELRRDGRVDAALAVARQQVRDQEHWWMPVLFSRLRDGRIWRDSEPAAPVPATSVPWQIPLPVADFVGRASAIVTLLQHLNPQRAPALATISGLAGSGKSQLAFALAAQVRERYPDGQVHVNLQGSRADPLPPARALAQVIAVFDPGTRLPTDEDALVALYGALFKTRRVLILADDARDAEQVQALVPPPGCALLITSRQRFSLPGMLLLELTALDDAEAVQLVRAICPRIGEPEAAALAARCGNLPLALRVSASILQADDSLPVARYLERLESTRAGLRQLRAPNNPNLDVEASIELSYSALDATAQQVLLLLGVFVADFDRAAAAAVAGIEDEAELDDALGALRRRNLIEVDLASERLQLQELVRAFALARLDEADAEAALWRYAWHYVAVAATAGEWYQAGGDQALEGLALFDLERLNLEVAWQWALTHAGTTDGDALIYQHVQACASVGELRYHIRDERIPRYEAALAAAEHLDVEHGWLYVYLGSCYDALGDHEAATNAYQQALELARAAEDRAAEAVALGGLGSAALGLGDPARALEYHAAHLAIAEELQDQSGVGVALNNLGLAYAGQGDHGQAIEWYERWLAITREDGNRSGEATALGNIGSAYHSLGDCEQAIGYYEQQLQIIQELGDRDSEALAFWNLGLSLLDAGETERAIALLEHSVAYHRETGHLDAEEDAAFLEQVRAEAAEAHTPKRSRKRRTSPA